MATAIALEDIFWEHETGAYHPETSRRLTAISEKLEKTSYFSNLIRPKVSPASIEQIATIHAKEYVLKFKELVKMGSGHLDPDTPYSEKSFDAASIAAGSGISLVDSIISGESQNGLAIVRPPGHHAEKNHGMGFCMFNNIAIAARYVQSKGFPKVLIVDWDVHHGNGTESAFYEDDTVYFVSLHQYPFYPGSGNVNDKGSGKGLNYNLNVPMQSGTGDDLYLEKFKNQVLKEIDKFVPDFILISAGFDAHANDPLGGLELSTLMYEKMSNLLKQKAKEYCNGRLLSFLEGGYDLKALADSVEAHLSVLVSE
ncbi:MAG: histone deacetylase [Leptospiraceae bacterium]|nr:histone deacetylase [Leptospiraceae bacterium]MCP5494020.1 histone deacetylase [Leptospiraceae bacterium]